MLPSGTGWKSKYSGPQLIDLPGRRTIKRTKARVLQVDFFRTWSVSDFIQHNLSELDFRSSNPGQSSIVKLDLLSLSRGDRGDVNRPARR